MKHRKESRREVTFKLTDDELLAKGQEAAEISRQKDEVELEFAAVKADFRERIEDKDKALSEALKVIREKSETRVADVVDFFDYEHGGVETYVGDRLICDRTLTAEERQMGLDFRKKGAPDPQGELELKAPADEEPIDLNALPDDWIVNLPDPTSIAGVPNGHEQYVPGHDEHITVVRWGGSQYLLEAGEAATFALDTEEAFGQPVRVWRKVASSKLGESLPGQPQPTA